MSHIHIELMRQQAQNSLGALIERCIEIKQGDKEFELLYSPALGWQASIGNLSQCVSLGEGLAEFYEEGKTPEEACAALLAKLEAA